jgi:hypothetical protein
MIHVIICEIVATNVMAGHPAHQAFHHALGWIPQQKRDGPAGSISADSGDLPQFLQVCYQCPVWANREAYAGDEDAIEEAFENRGKSLVPNRIDEDQRFRRQKPIGVGRNERPIELDVMVLNSFSLTQDRVESFCVEITVVDLVAARAQSRDDLAMQPRAETGADWVCI